MTPSPLWKNWVFGAYTNIRRGPAQHLQSRLSKQLHLRSIWASAWQNLQHGMCAQKDSDQLGHPPSLISLFCAHCTAKDPSFLQANSRDSDQTGQMPRLIWVFAGHTCHFKGFVMCWLIFYIAWLYWKQQTDPCLFVLRFYGPVNPMGSCRARSVYLTTLYWAGLVL